MYGDIIICGSKGYNNISLSPIVDYFDFIVRNNMNIPKKNYGNKSSTIQILNCHVYQNYKSKERLLSTYNFLASEGNIIDFYDYMKNIHKGSILTFERNNTNLMISIMSEKGINLNIDKEIRCGLSYIPELIKSNKNPFIIGFSLSVSEFNLHQINNKFKKVNDSGHDRELETKIIKILHDRELIDATFCSILDRENITLDCSKLEPSEKSINILLDIYGEVTIDNPSNDFIEKFNDKFILNDNNLIIKNKHQS